MIEKLSLLQLGRESSAFIIWSSSEVCTRLSSFDEFAEEKSSNSEILKDGFDDELLSSAFEYPQTCRLDSKCWIFKQSSLILRFASDNRQNISDFS